MRQLQKVLWTKGVLLTPQHFQVQERYLEDLVGFRLSALTYCPWGFSRLEVDREALAGGSLALVEASGILPDGLPFELPGSDPAPPPKPLEDLWLADQDALVLHLALPERRADGVNVASSRSERSARYLAEVVLRRDENTGLGEKPIQVARKHFRLVAQSESLDGVVSLPVARVVRAPGGGYQLDPRFVPPLLDLAASDYLTAIARRLVELLVAKSGDLSGTRRQRNKGLADFGASDVANFWLLYTVNTHLPRFRHLFETRGGHPSALYTAMAELAGALTTFSNTVRPRDLPEYNHGDPGPCFTRLDEQLRELLETVVPANHVTLPLRATESAIYATAIDQDRYFAASELYLALRAEVKEGELQKQAPGKLKASSADRIAQLIRQALPGIALRHEPRPPSALPVKLDYQYFRIDRSGPDWEAIKRAGNLAVHVPADFPDPRLELVVVLPADDR